MTLAGYVTVAPVMGCHVPELPHLAPVYITPAPVTVEGLAHSPETPTSWCTPCGRPVVSPPGLET